MSEQEESFQKSKGYIQEKDVVICENMQQLCQQIILECNQRKCKQINVSIIF